MSSTSNDLTPRRDMDPAAVFTRRFTTENPRQAGIRERNIHVWLQNETFPSHLRRARQSPPEARS